MEEIIRYLLKNPEEIKAMGRCAYETIAYEWNAGKAASRLLAMIEGWQSGKEISYEEGPLSPAPVISPRKMYKYMMKEAKRR